jgi:ABC-type transporter Mla subunit MlaD
MTAGRWLVIGLLAVSLAAGCGGDDGGGGSSTTEWADGVCSAITTWSESITSTADSLRGGNLTEDELRNAVDDFESATSDFVDDLTGLEAPDTESGEQAKESLDELSANVEQNVSTMKSAVDDASGTSGVLEAISTVSATLSTMGKQLSAMFTELEQLDPGGELERAFSDADSCDELESGGS